MSKLLLVNEWIFFCSDTAVVSEIIHLGIQVSLKLLRAFAVCINLGLAKLISLHSENKKKLFTVTAP